MPWLASAIPLLLALAIIAIGSLYILNPRVMTGNFGLPLPPDSPQVDGWLRLKGVRDIASGLTVIAFMIWGSPAGVGLVLAVSAFIPVGDMLTILAARGSTTSALAIHGTTALVMILTALSLLTGAA